HTSVQTFPTQSGDDGPGRAPSDACTVNNSTVHGKHSHTDPGSLYQQLRSSGSTWLSCALYHQPDRPYISTHLTFNASSHTYTCSSQLAKDTYIWQPHHTSSRDSDPDYRHH